MRRKMYAISYASLFIGPTVQFHRSTENCSIARLIRVGCYIFYSSKIHNIRYILLKQKLLEPTENFKKRFGVGSLQIKQLAVVIKVVRN